MDSTRKQGVFELGRTTFNGYDGPLSVKIEAVYPGYIDGGGVAIQVQDVTDEDYEFILSVNIPEAGPLPEGEFFAKLWTENEILRAPMLATGIFEDTGKRLQINAAIAEVWRIAPAQWESIKAAA